MNIKNMCCNQFDERQNMQDEINRHKLTAKRAALTITELRKENKQLRQQLEQILREEDEGVEE